MTLYLCPRSDLRCTALFTSTGDLDDHYTWIHGYRRSSRYLASLRPAGRPSTPRRTESEDRIDASAAYSPAATARSATSASPAATVRAGGRVPSGGRVRAAAGEPSGARTPGRAAVPENDVGGFGPPATAGAARFQRRRRRETADTDAPTRHRRR
jgi:hypothetical protein